jgi:predicted dehydrogenase
VEETVPVDPNLAVDLYTDFARAIRTGAAPFAKPEETLAVMRLIDRCRQSAPGIADLRK